MDPESSPGQANQPSSSGKSKNWTPRACDRCRKRKARCDESIPCKNCADAGAECTHLAPVLRRGPRPRRPQQPKDLESRLRNLEHLIASIPGSGSGQSASLSLSELAQIRQAAAPYLSSPSGGEGLAAPASGAESTAAGASGMQGSLGTGPSHGQSEQGQGGAGSPPDVFSMGSMGGWMNGATGGEMDRSQGAGASGMLQQPAFGTSTDMGAYDSAMGAVDGSGAAGLPGQDQSMGGWGYDLTPEMLGAPGTGSLVDGAGVDGKRTSETPGSAGYPQASGSGFSLAGSGQGHGQGHAHGQAQYGQMPPPSSGGHEHAPKQTQGQDLMYTDAQGQTRFLGPSSGMPLLDKLKPEHTPPPAHLSNSNNPGGGRSLVEEWISLSAATGIALPANTPLPRAGASPAYPGAHSAPPGGTSTLDSTETWDRLASLLPLDLIDSLVRSYFTISHLLWPIMHAPTFMEMYEDQAGTYGSRRSPAFVGLVMALCCLSSRYVEDSRLSALVPSSGAGDRHRTPSTKGKQAAASSGTPQTQHAAGSTSGAPPSPTQTTVAAALLALARETITKLACEQTNLQLVQAMFCMSVVQEGTARPNLLWVYLSQALSMAIDLGLHRRVDDYSAFSPVDLEVRNRTMWAIYCQTIKASCTYGRPSMIRLGDLSCDEPAAVDDIYITPTGGIGNQPPDQPSVMAGFIVALRLHMILERVIRRINRYEQPLPAFRSLLESPSPTAPTPADTFPSFSSLNPYPSSSTTGAAGPAGQALDDPAFLLSLLPRVAEGVPGDWQFSTTTVADPDSVRFFVKTRAFTLRLYIQLLTARHGLSQMLERMSREGAGMGGSGTGSPEGGGGGGDAGSPGTGTTAAKDEAGVLSQVTQYALGIVGTYCAIDARGRLGFFGAHAIAQITQAGAGLISVILHLASGGGHTQDSVWHLAMQGLPAAIQVLRQLGKRRPAGMRSAELLAEFSHACRIPVYTDPSSAQPNNGADRNAGGGGGVDVPMLRSLPRRSSSFSAAQPEYAFGPELEAWFGEVLTGDGAMWIEG